MTKDPTENTKNAMKGMWNAVMVHCRGLYPNRTYPDWDDLPATDQLYIGNAAYDVLTFMAVLGQMRGQFPNGQLELPKQVLKSVLDLCEAEVNSD